MNHSTKSPYVVAGVTIIAALMLVTGVLAGSIFVAPQINRDAQAAPIPQNISDSDLVAAFERTMMDVYQESLPSIVNIRVTTSLDLSLFDDAPPEDHPEFFNQGGGSGFVWDNKGHIVTNNHVVEDATDIDVIFPDDTRVSAEVVGVDPDSDLAVIKVDLPGGKLKPIALGNSDDVQVGQLAIAIGNPFGQEFTMTSGIVSAKGRLIRGGNSGFSIPETIQTDAPINPGNSGGPLLNRTGEVIGINAQMFSRTGSSSGIGFAIPVNIAKKVVPTLIEGGDYKYAWLGISGGEVTADISEFRALANDVTGAVVLEVVEDSPADKGGLLGRDESLAEDAEAFLYGGDIITAIDGTLIAGIDDLISYLVSQVKPGDTVTLDIIRADGEETQLDVTLGTRPE